jgi:hypothetical protein
MVYLFFVSSLAVWRLSHLLSEENGPFNISYRLRLAAGTGFFGAMLSCFYCCSVWVAVPFAVYMGQGYGNMFVQWLALSGAACLLQKASSKNEVNKAKYFED